MKFKLAILFLTAFLFLGCNHSASAPESQIVETYIPDANSVVFDIEAAPGSSTAWIGTYSSQGKIARFRFELGPAKSTDYPIKDFPVTSGKGRFISVTGSDASVLLSDLKKALEARKLPTKITRVAELPFAYVTLGEHQSQASSDGGFRDKPRGNWTLAKIFIGEGEQECEFFLNLNPVIKKGQFSIKDPDYGDEIVAQLAKVL
jgi:hypothetical protein